MKKLFILSVFSFLFFSCQNTFTPHDFEIKNVSSKDVSFQLVKYQDKNIYELKSGESITLDLNDNPKITFMNNPRVIWISGYDSGNIKDMTSYSVKFENNSLYPVIISESNNMLTDTYGDTVTIPAATINADNTATAGTVTSVIYTKNPSFSAYYTDQDGLKIDALKFIAYSLN